MEKLELPEVCRACEERLAAEKEGFGPDASCYNCEHELERFPPEDWDWD